MTAPTEKRGFIMPDRIPSHCWHRASGLLPRVGSLPRELRRCCHCGLEQTFEYVELDISGEHGPFLPKDWGTGLGRMWADEDKIPPCFVMYWA